MRYKWLLILFIFLACNSHKQEAATSTSQTSTVLDSVNKKESGGVPDKPVAHNFWDTVTAGIKLTYEQIEKHTSLESEWGMDSFYISSYDTIEFKFRETLGYWPDSTFTTTNGLKVAIIKHSGPNCLKKFLLVFDSTVTHNLSNTEIEEGCDSDGDDEPYSFQDYKILSDSVFETIETYNPGDADKTDWNLTITTTKWKINNKGLIVSMGRKMIKKEPKDRPKD